MNLEEFLKALEKTPRDWYLDGDRIRRIRHGYSTCPICEVNGNAGVSWWMTDLLESSLAADVVTAADTGNSNVRFFRESYRGKLRLRLLEACGLPTE